MKNANLFPKIPGLLNDVANKLRIARIEKQEDLTNELRINFIWIKEFIDMMSIDSMSVSGEGAAKFSFIINNVHRNLKFITGDYKEKAVDQNACSIFYDLENLYEFNKKIPFPKELDKELSKELIALLGEMLNLFTTTNASGNILLKGIGEINKKQIKFDRDSKHFQYFSYYKDLEHLNAAIELIEFIAEIDITSLSGRYQWVSGVSQAIEHLSKRMLSPRMIHYLSSDINSDALASIRNFIVHREQDSSAILEGIISNQDRFLLMKKEIEVIKLSLVETLNHLYFAVKPKVMQGDVFQRVEIFTNADQDETVDSISKFYEKTGSSYKYSKIPHNILINCESIAKFEDSYPELSRKITTANKEVIVSAALLGNRKLFIKIVEQIEGSLKAHFISTRQDGYKVIKKEIDLLKKDNKIEIAKLKELNFPDNNPKLTGLDETVFTTKKIQFYKNKLKEFMTKIKSLSDGIELIDLYNTGIDFNAYRVMDVPLYRLLNSVSEEYIQSSTKARSLVPQRYIEDTNFYNIRLMYGPDAYKTLEANEIGLGVTEFGAIVYQTWGGQDYLRSGDIGRALYCKILEMIINHNAKIDAQKASGGHFPDIIPQITLSLEEEKVVKEFIISAKNLQFILIPLTNEEHAYIYQDNLQAHQVSFRRNRVLDEGAIQRLKEVFRKADMQDRMKNYLAFLESSEELLSQRNLLLEAELYLMAIAGLIKESKQARSSLPDSDILKDFRNYLAHDRELGGTSISHSHEQISLKIILEFSKKSEEIIIPALRNIIKEGVVVESDLNDVIVLNIHDIKYSLEVGEEQNMLLVKLLQDPEISSQIVSLIHEKGLKEVKEIFFGQDQVDKKILDDIEKIEAIIGKDTLSKITNFYQFISGALRDHSPNNFYHKILSIMGDMADNIQQILDFSYIYDVTYLNDQVLAIFEQLENYAIFIGDSHSLIPYFRPPQFPPDDFDYYPDGSEGGEQNGRIKDNDIDQMTIIFSTNTTFDDVDYTI